jgi:hypothetical protein
MSIAGHMRQAEACREMLQNEAKRIADSTEARVWLNKNVSSAPAEECLKVALRCIYDLTGDHAMLSDIKKLEAKT